MALLLTAVEGRLRLPASSDGTPAGPLKGGDTREDEE